MGQRTLARYLIEEQRNKGVINADLRLLIEVVSRACKTISIAVGKGALGGVLGDAGSANVQGEAQKKLDVLSNEILLRGQRMGRPPGRPWRPRKWTGRTPFPTAIRRANTCCCSIRSTARPTSTSTSRSAPSSRCCDARRARPGTPEAAEQPSCSRARTQVAPATRSTARRTMLVLTVGDGVDVLHARPRAGQLRADPGQHADPRRHPGVRDQHVQPAPLGSADAALRRRAAGRQAKARAARTSTCAGSASMVADVHRILTRGGIFMYPMDAKTARQGRQAAPDVRSQPDGLHRRTGRRRGDHRPRSAFSTSCRNGCTSACR